MRLLSLPVYLFLLLFTLGSLAQAQSNATPAIRYVTTTGTNADPATLYKILGFAGADVKGFHKKRE